MITDDVHTVLFEAACFDGTNIRLSSKRIGLRTDASGKFEKGLDPNNAKAAIDRACQLMEELGAGEVVGGMVDICNKVSEPSRVKFEPDRINGLLGTNLSKEEMLGYLAKIELTYDEETNEIVAPTFRQDIHCMADVQKKLHVSTDMTRFLQLCHPVRLLQEKCHSSFALKISQEILQSTADSQKA